MNGQRRKPSDRIGVYRIESCLGRGGMGEVYLAWDEKLRRHVALKFLHRLGSGAEEGRARLLREARAAARLSHPAIVHVHDVLETEDGDCIVMEYVRGSTIRQLLHNRHLTPDLAVRLAGDVAGALAEAHANGLVHRDLKAENVLVTEAGRAKVLDFGLAHQLWRGPGETTVSEGGRLVGTVPCMSPEQALGKKVDHRSDLFSLGVLLYEMLAGRPPFRGAGISETLERVVAAEPTPLAELQGGLPAPLTGLVDRLLAREPGDRPMSARAVELELGALLTPSGGAGPQALPASPGTVGSEAPTVSGAAWTPPQTAARNRHRVRTGAVVTLAVLLLASLWMLFRAQEQPPHRRVLVLVPEAGPEAEALAAAVLDASLDLLGSLRRLSPVDPGAAGEDASPVSATRAAGADEALRATVKPWTGGLYRISLRRIDGSTGEVLWSTGFEAPGLADPRSLRLVADSVAAHLRRAYPRHDPWGESSLPEVRDEDYRAYLELRREILADGLATEDRWERAEAVVRGSPRFLGAYLTAADQARLLYGERVEASWLDRAEALADAARKLAPADPRPLFVALRIALDRGELEAAEGYLTQLEALAPGFAEVTVARAVLAEARGEAEEALRFSRQAAERWPSWQNLLRRAEAERRSGHVEAARASLEELLERSPGNTLGLSRLAELELAYGDLARAEALYCQLLDQGPRRSLYTNLGLVYHLERRYDDAAESYRRALALAPGHRTVLLNLADNEMAAGRTAEARELYAQVRDQLLAAKLRAPLDAFDTLTLAQCLAQLGDRDAALALIAEALDSDPGDGEVTYMAAVVYTLAGERDKALAAAAEALGRGVQRRWFEIPSFDALSDDPGFAALFQDDG